MPCIRTCMFGSKNGLEKMREEFEKWDLRILVLYILFTQLSLHAFGRHRKKSMSRKRINVIVWFFYWFSDLLATIALGKLSKLKGDTDDIKPMNLLRGLWAPIILFYLGGPDTMIVLRLEENQMWSRHAMGLITLGARTSYVLILTWTSRLKFPLLALLMLLPGLIKYGERVWVIKSIADKKYVGLVQNDESTIDEGSDIDPQKAQQTPEIAKANLKKAEGKRQIIEATAPPNAKLVLQAYSCFQTLMPHMSNYECEGDKVKKLVNDFRELIKKEKAANIFKLIEIELGFMYDMHFSKVGSIFTAWGIILRFISLSCIVTVLVGFFLVRKPPGLLPGDLPITVILLAGTLYLEIAGVLLQLGSDWAIVWAYKHYPSKLNTPVFRLHEVVVSERKRWSELMGQFSLVNFKNNNKMVVDLSGIGKTWTEVSPTLKELIISQLLKTSQKGSAVETSQASSMKRGPEVEPSQALGPEVETSQASSLKRGPEVEILQASSMKRGPEVEISRASSMKRGPDLGDFDADWGVKLEFGESIVVWHVATDFFYQLEKENSKLNLEKVEATKILSYYMMHLLVMRSPPLPYCNNTEKFHQAVKNHLKESKSANVSFLDHHSSNATVIEIQKLAHKLMEKENKWEIMSNVWIEMLCYAASRCSVYHHVQELRHGGQFLTHVWLLLMHLGVTKKQGKITAQESGLEDVPDPEINADTQDSNATCFCF